MKLYSLLSSFIFYILLSFIFTFFGGKGEFEDLIQFDIRNVFILLLIDTKINLLYCVK